MLFKITSAGNNSTCGDLFFTVPSPEAMESAVQEISGLCRVRVGELYGGMNYASPRLEAELTMMRKTDTAFHFALLKEIADLSRREGYPVLPQGNLAGSMIAFLLGITSINPLPPHYRCHTADCEFFCEGNVETDLLGVDLTDKNCHLCGEHMNKDGYNIAIESVWGTKDNPQAPDFSMGIAAPTRSLIHNQLDSKFAFVDSDNALYKQLTLADSALCERIGDLAKATGVSPNTAQYQDKVYLQVLKNIADDLVDELTEFKESGHINNEHYVNGMSFAEELKSVISCDFCTLTKIYGYIHGSFSDAKALKNIYEWNFFTLRDDFFEALISCGVPDEVALDLAKRGVWSLAEKRKEYLSILGQYDVPQTLQEYFNCVTNLWPASACISRLQLMCAIAWYQINYPEEFTK